MSEMIVASTKWLGENGSSSSSPGKPRALIFVGLVAGLSKTTLRVFVGLEGGFTGDLLLDAPRDETGRANKVEVANGLTTERDLASSFIWFRIVVVPECEDGKKGILGPASEPADVPEAVEATDARPSLSLAVLFEFCCPFLLTGMNFLLLS